MKKNSPKHHSVQFHFNQYGVCENPMRETIYKTKKVTCKVFLASKNGHWAYGYDFELKGMGTGAFRASGLPSFSEHRKIYLSKGEARRIAIAHGINCFENAQRYHNVKTVIQELKKAMHPQLTLF